MESDMRRRRQRGEGFREQGAESCLLRLFCSFYGIIQESVRFYKPTKVDTDPSGPQGAALRLL
eukprot:7069189-Karenia_brevis.AAC.1